MQKLLTIAIPTYNRAELLDQQLERVFHAVQGYENLCDVFVSNNQSTDDTAVIIEKWCARFSNISVFTQKENIGAVRNISWCLKQARSKFVWALSDDDPLIENSLPQILQRLKDNPDLAVMLLNFSTFNSRDGSNQSERKFTLLEDENVADGMSLFSKHISRGAMGALVFTSVLIYRSEYAREALNSWKKGYKNLLYQLYITAYCSTRGRFLITRDVYIQFMAGRSFFQKDKQLEVKMKLGDVPQTYAYLMELGYSRRLCKQLFVNHMKGKHFDGLRMWLQIARFSLRHPAKAVRGLALLSQSFFVIWRGAEKLNPQQI